MELVEKYCQIHTACYMWLSASLPVGDWTGSDVTTYALSVYLVGIGIRPACRIVWGKKGVEWEQTANKYIVPLGLCVTRLSSTELIVANSNPWLDAKKGLGLCFGNVFPEEDILAMKGGVLTWVVSTKGGNMNLWSEPIGRPESFSPIEVELSRLRAALCFLGYSVHVRIE